ALVIVGGVVLLTFIPVYFDYRARMAKNRPGTDRGDLELLKKRVELLEDQLSEKDARLKLVERDLNFVSRLLEDKTGGQA
ncbi:MAG TPA: hypothetical protein PK625_01890, partial [Spirochaetales bacterium]|nr:hypothetical protein [Spirochaetales bacterium]